MAGDVSRAGEFGIVSGTTPTGETSFYNHFPTGANPNEDALKFRAAFIFYNNIALGPFQAETNPSHINQLNLRVFGPWGVRKMADYTSFNEFEPVPENGGLRTGLKNVTLPSGFGTANHKGAFGTTDWTRPWANYNPRQENY